MSEQEINPSEPVLPITGSYAYCIQCSQCKERIFQVGKFEKSKLHEKYLLLFYELLSFYFLAADLTASQTITFSYQGCSKCNGMRLH